MGSLSVIGERYASAGKNGICVLPKQQKKQAEEERQG
jgi:hypothetical protein